MLSGRVLKLPRLNLARFFVGEGAEPTPVELGQRRVYILPTRHGIFIAGLLLVMLLGAINYNTSLGYGLVFLLAGLGVIAILHTYRNLLHLSIDIGRIPPVFAGDTLQVPVLLHNRLPASRYAIRAHFAGEGSASIDIEAATTTTLHIGHLCPQRGLHALPRLTLHTVYPLGWFHAWAHVQAERRFLVYPKPVRHHELPRETSYHLNVTGYRGHGSDDFAGLRSYHPGDSLRHIHWKTVARGQGLYTKQFGGDRADELWLDWDALPDLDTEARLSCLTQWVIDAQAANYSYGLRLPGRVIALGSGPAHHQQCLEALALFARPGATP